jgi:hypothetical protein
MSIIRRFPFGKIGSFMAHENVVHGLVFPGMGGRIKLRYEIERNRLGAAQQTFLIETE